MQSPSSLLNPKLAIAVNQQAYASQRRVTVNNIFSAAFATELVTYLRERQEWNLVFRDNDKHYDLHPLQLRALTPERNAQLQQRVLANARLGFQYFYCNVPLYDMRRQKSAMHTLLTQLCEVLESTTFINLMRQITADRSIDFADYQVTKFLAGHFLKSHDDNVAGKNRRVAYVISLTPDWSADWGGLLHFVAPDGEVTHSLRPAFNALTLFEVPQQHFVSYVSPFANQPRVSITGWLRTLSKAKDSAT